MLSYNLLCFGGWAYVLFLLVSGPVSGAYDRVHLAVEIVQSFALAEIVFAAVGWVKTSVMTTIMQVSSRLFLVFGVVYAFNDPSVRQSPFYYSMVLAWSITEVIRYPFYAFQLLGMDVYLIKWARYTFFYVLYPVGAGSEWLLVYAASKIAPPASQWGLIAIMLIYVPGFPHMYFHMIRQRSKALKVKKN
ncbi:tyrosine phosphatase-like protein [Gorgonomyces haynaldii]|nr:tyrosine phosphatase-like protein [Gorgonomyces haynaldii]